MELVVSHHDYFHFLFLYSLDDFPQGILQEHGESFKMCHLQQGIHYTLLSTGVASHYLCMLDLVLVCRN